MPLDGELGSQAILGFQPGEGESTGAMECWYTPESELEPQVVFPAIRTEQEFGYDSQGRVISETIKVFLSESDEQFQVTTNFTSYFEDGRIQSITSETDCSSSGGEWGADGIIDQRVTTTYVYDEALELTEYIVESDFDADGIIDEMGRHSALPPGECPPDGSELPPDGPGLPPDAGLPPDGPGLPPDPSLPPEGSGLPPDGLELPPEFLLPPPVELPPPGELPPPVELPPDGLFSFQPTAQGALQSQFGDSSSLVKAEDIGDHFPSPLIQFPFLVQESSSFRSPANHPSPTGNTRVFSVTSGVEDQNTASRQLQSHVDFKFAQTTVVVKNGSSLLECGLANSHEKNRKSSLQVLDFQSIDNFFQTEDLLSGLWFGLS